MFRKNNYVYDKLVSFVASSPGKRRSLSQCEFLAGVSPMNHVRKQQYTQHLSRVLQQCP